MLLKKIILRVMVIGLANSFMCASDARGGVSAGPAGAGGGGASAGASSTAIVRYASGASAGRVGAGPTVAVRPGINVFDPCWLWYQLPLTADPKKVKETEDAAFNEFYTLYWPGHHHASLRQVGSFTWITQESVNERGLSRLAVFGYKVKLFLKVFLKKLLFETIKRADFFDSHLLAPAPVKEGCAPPDYPSLRFNSGKLEFDDSRGDSAVVGLVLVTTNDNKVFCFLELLRGDFETLLVQWDPAAPIVSQITITGTLFHHTKEIPFRLRDEVLSANPDVFKAQEWLKRGVRSHVMRVLDGGGAESHW